MTNADAASAKLLNDGVGPRENQKNACSAMLINQVHMPIIFITVYGDVPTTVRAMKASAVEFLIKPFSNDAMLSAIQQAIDRSENALDRDLWPTSSE